MQRWEYATVEIRGQYEGVPTAAVDNNKEMRASIGSVDGYLSTVWGDAGWELVAAVASDDLEGVTLFFKRPVDG